jgi:amidase
VEPALQASLPVGTGTIMRSPSTLSAVVLGIAAAAAAPRAETHRFVPSASDRAISPAARSPALRIKSGDRVITTTGDEAATRAGEEARAAAAGVYTGPFLVEGAEPGDLIVVTIEKLRPNRTTGTSPSFMAPVSIDAGGLSNKPAPQVPWVIDAAKGVVRFDLAAVMPNVNWRERYRSPIYELPLSPMLGTLGVAPSDDDASSGRTAGAFGGDLDYAGITAGTRVMLPVFQPGALLSLGRGYARLGDGAAGGGGIQTSMDVEFSVELVKKKGWPHSSVMRAPAIAGEFPIEWPRLDTDEYVMTAGSATALLEALQHATTELHHWLDDDYGFSERSLSIFLGQALEYEIASVADHRFTVIAKVRKSYLPQEAAAK